MITILVQQAKEKEDDGESKSCKPIETSRQTYVKEFRKVSVTELFLFCLVFVRFVCCFKVCPK